MIDNSSFWDIIVVTLITSTLSPSVMVMLKNRYDKKKEERDNLRRDTEAKRTAEVAEAVHQVAVQTREAARLLVESNAEVATAAKHTNEKLEVIHVLVNSKVSVLIEQVHDTSVLALASTLELMDLKKKHGEEPSAHDLAEIATLRRRIAEMSLTMLDRAAHDAEAKGG